MAEGIKKLYYSIGEVSELTGLDAHVLRYWEGEFDELKPNKNRGGRRIYTEEDIAVVQRIQQLLRDDKYTIEGAKQVLAREAAAPGADGAFDRELKAIRAFLRELRERLP